MGWYLCLYGSILYGTTATLFRNPYIRVFIQKIYLPLLLAALAMFIGFRSPRVDRDYGEYLAWFQRVSDRKFQALDWAKDPAFAFTSYVISWSGWHYVAVALLYAVVAVLLQAWFARLVSGRQYLTLSFYLIVCMIFFNYDMTEIRAAVAVPLMSIAIIRAMRGQRGQAILLMGLALVSHLSSLIGLPVFLLAFSSRGISSRWWILIMGPAVLAANLFLHPLLTMLADMGRVADYLNGNVQTESLRLLSVYFVVRITSVAVATVVYWPKLSREERLAVLCSAFGLFIQVLFSFNDALGLRGAELFALFDVWVLIMPVTKLKSEWRTVYVLGLIVLGFVLFRSGMKLMAPYATI